MRRVWSRLWSVQVQNGVVTVSELARKPTQQLRGAITNAGDELAGEIDEGENYVGGEVFVNKGDQAESVETIIDASQSAPAEFGLPKVTKVRAQIDEYDSLTVRGQVENPLQSPLSSFADIFVVLFGEGGKVIGGGFTYLDAALPPGRNAGFDAYLSAVPSEAIVKAEATMQNSIDE